MSLWLHLKFIWIVHYILKKWQKIIGSHRKIIKKSSENHLKTLENHLKMSMTKNMLLIWYSSMKNVFWKIWIILSMLTTMKSFHVVWINMDRKETHGQVLVWRFFMVCQALCGGGRKNQFTSSTKRKKSRVFLCKCSQDFSHYSKVQKYYRAK